MSEMQVQQILSRLDEQGRAISQQQSLLLEQNNLLRQQNALLAQQNLLANQQNDLLRLTIHTLATIVDAVAPQGLVSSVDSMLNRYADLMTIQAARK